MSNKSKNWHKGFTYLEIVLVIAIISYVVVTFSQFIMKSTIADKTSLDLVVASNFARSKLEQLRATPFYFIGDSSGTFLSNRKKYDWLVEVWFMTEDLGKLTVAPVMTDLKMANVFVNWFRGNNKKKYSMSALFTNYSGVYHGNASFSGRVESGNSGIANAFVGIPNSPVNTYTGYDGRYKLRAVPAGTFSVVATKPGHTSETICVENLSFGEERNDVNFLLRKIKK